MEFLPSLQLLSSNSQTEIIIMNSRITIASVFFRGHSGDTPQVGKVLLHQPVKPQMFVFPVAPDNFHGNHPHHIIVVHYLAHNMIFRHQFINLLFSFQHNFFLRVIVCCLLVCNSIISYIYIYVK